MPDIMTDKIAQLQIDLASAAIKNMGQPVTKERLVHHLAGQKHWIAAVIVNDREEV